jgi:hypothetical protein
VDRIAQARALRNWLALGPMAKVLDSLDYLTDKYGATANTYFSGSSAQVYVNLRDLNGLKDENLAAFLYSMEHLNAKETTCADNAESFSRVFSYAWHETETQSQIYVGLTVYITASFKSDSDTCKRVIVGYNAPSDKPTPIYKLECVDGGLGSMGAEALLGTAYSDETLAAHAEVQEQVVAEAEHYDPRPTAAPLPNAYKARTADDDIPF